MSRGYACIALSNPKFEVNIGSAMRACNNFDAAMLVVSGRRFAKFPTDTQKSYRHIPVLQVKDVHDAVPYDCVPVAVDIIEDATPLTEYKHPERAYYIFGAEDATLGAKVLDWCKDVVYVPTNHCMNLAATVHVVLYDRLLKQQK